MSGNIDETRGTWAIAPGLLLISALVGWLAAIKLSLPTPWFEAVSFSLLRPFHTFLFISALLFAQHKWADSLLGFRSNALTLWQQRLFLLFMVSAAFDLFTGTGSGREYFSWAPWSTALLLLSRGLYLWALIKHRQALQQRSPEGFWLIGFGGFFIFWGLLEAELRHLPAVNTNFILDLSLQWHAIDGFWAGVNASLYGYGIFLLNAKPKPLRRLTLFIIATFSLLFTFGHHHYASPQPEYLKNLALVASLLVLVSLFRHIRAYIRNNWHNIEQPYLAPLLQSVEWWTIVAAVSGIVFAIPQLNILVHGTYFVLIHAMGSVIGINLMLVLANCYDVCSKHLRVNVRRVRDGVRLVNIALFSLWLALGFAAVIKGLERTSDNYTQFHEIAQYCLIALPIMGTVLLSGIILLCGEALRLALSRTGALKPYRGSALLTEDFAIKAGEQKI